MPLTRFAPAPTGQLHLGHLVNALYVWGMGRALVAAVLLRIEDHDRQRCRPEYEAALLDDLDWLGLWPDLGTTAQFRSGPSQWRQSDCGPVYQAAVERLRRAGHRVYACECSRREQDDGAPGRYSGRCRERGLAEGLGRGLRVELPEGPETFRDLRLGTQRQEPARQCGDLLLRDRLGNWTYQFAVVVDDLRQEVDLVIRGEDLLDSTGRQLLLARMLGRKAPPRFLHHPLVLKPSGDKLSKASRDTSLQDLRRAGASRETLIGRALHAAGLRANPEPCSLDEALAVVAAGLPADRPTSA